MSRTNNRSKPITTYIDQIVRELKQLQVQQNALIAVLAQKARQQTNSATTEPADSELAEGDKVTITNKYRGHKGVTGTIIRVTSKSVDISTPIGKLTKRKRNVKRTTEP